MLVVTDAREQIAAEVRAELARQNKPQSFVAEALDLDAGSVSLRLAGKRAFRADELATIAKALGVPATQFMERVA